MKEYSKATDSELKAKSGHGLSSSPLSFSPFGFSIDSIILLETKFTQIRAVLITCCFKHWRLSLQPRCVIHKTLSPVRIAKIKSYVLSYPTFYPLTSPYSSSPLVPGSLLTSALQHDGRTNNWKQLVEKTAYLMNHSFVLSVIFLPFHCELTPSSHRESKEKGGFKCGFHHILTCKAFRFC